MAGCPDHVPGVTIDRQCGSSQQSVHFAAQAVMSGTSDLIVAGGVQNMSQIPISSAMTAPSRSASGSLLGLEGLGRALRHPGGVAVPGAEMIAEKWDVSREDMEVFALESHERAIAPSTRGASTTRSSPTATSPSTRGRAAGTSLEKMANLQPLEEGGRLTAAVSSQISDGAAALLVASEEAVKEHGLTPRARVHHMSVRGADPIWMLTAPIPATATRWRRPA